MKLKLVAVAVTSMLAAGVVNAAEIYNKDGNKLDLYGKVTGLHYFSDDAGADGDKTYVRIGFKGETQVNDQLSGYGQWEYQIQGNKDEGDNQSKTRLAFAGLKFAEAGSFDYGRNYGVLYDVTPGLTFCQNSAVTPTVPTTSCSLVLTAWQPTVTGLLWSG
jgi:outer membrane pore protein C